MEKVHVLLQPYVSLDIQRDIMHMQNRFYRIQKNLQDHKHFMRVKKDKNKNKFDFFFAKRYLHIKYHNRSE